MPIPTFNSIALFSAAARDVPDSPEVRVAVDTLPGVDGAYAQPLGQGWRTIRASGLLSATAASPPEAHAALKAALRQRQALADGRTLAAYVGADAAEYANCLLQAFAADGRVRIARQGTDYTAYVPCAATLLQLTP